MAQEAYAPKTSRGFAGAFLRGQIASAPAGSARRRAAIDVNIFLQTLGMANRYLNAQNWQRSIAAMRARSGRNNA